MNYKVILDLPDSELYSIINNLRSEAIKQRATETDEETQEGLDCRVAELNQIAGELAETGDILGEDRAWLLSLLNSSPSIKPWIERVKKIENQAFQKVKPICVLDNIYEFIDLVEEEAYKGTIEPWMEERIVGIEQFLERMVA